MKNNLKTLKETKAEASKKVAIVVLGMHRSGTSLLGGILDSLGCKGPKTKLPANEKNAKGYFESKVIVSLNDEIFAAAGTFWSDWRPLREGWLESPRFNEFRLRAVEVIQSEYGDASMIYLKDPRICRLLPFWQDILESIGYHIICIHTHRHPSEVAKSLKARKNIAVDPSIGMLLWLRHVLEAEMASRDFPRMFTSYDSLILHWQRFAERAENTLGVVWPVAPHMAQERMAQFVDPSLRNHELKIETFLHDPMIAEAFRETLRVLESWADNGEDKNDRITLERLYDHFNLSSSLLYAPVSALEASNRDVENLSSEVERLHTQLDQYYAESGILRKQIEADKAAMEALIKELETAERHASNLSDEVLIWTNRIIERDKEISKLRRSKTTKDSGKEEKENQKNIDRQFQIELASARSEPRKIIIDYITFHLLSYLSLLSPPITKKTSTRFLRSAEKRNPQRSLK